MLGRDLEEGGDLRAQYCFIVNRELGGGGVVTIAEVVALCVQREKQGRGIPRGPAGVHVAKDRLLI